MDVTLTGRELDIMTILWQLGSGTVAEVRTRGEPVKESA